MDINMDMLQWLINFLIISNKELAEELHKPVIRKEKYIYVLQIIFGLQI